MTYQTISRDEIIRLTGRLLTKMTPAQLQEAERAAAKHGVYVAEYGRRRLVPRIIAGAAR